MQGAFALIATAAIVAKANQAPPPHVLLCPDIGRGDGTIQAFGMLAEVISRIEPDIVVFHYMKPLVSLMFDAVSQIDQIRPQATLVADAGGMYAAKAAGVAQRFELMTPDVGEIGFLADPDTQHPAYSSKFIFGGQDFNPKQLAGRAWESGGSARTLIIKGAVDHICREGRVVAQVSEPSVPSLEAIGGTGDTLTGIVAALMAAGLPTVDAATMGCEINRRAGEDIAATPATSVSQLIGAIRASM
ncbi:MAG: hypothetical protein M1617_06330 [Actinobacteria bacterium]|nr:hypothetical protein [Actinomycetota bacterium]MCL5887887.1 hypothetical protein [Actinomycetota bacterium]